MHVYGILTVKLYPEDTMYNLFRVYISFDICCCYDIFYK